MEMSDDAERNCCFLLELFPSLVPLQMIHSQITASTSFQKIFFFARLQVKRITISKLHRTAGGSIAERTNLVK